MGISCRHCAFCFDHALLSVEAYVKGQVAKQQQAEDEIAKHQRRAEAMT